jgi:hypothetical protein
MPINYENACIYKIVCKDVNITEKYIGSTTNLIQRHKAHKTTCYNDNAKRHNTFVYQFIRENGSFDNWDVVLIEKVIDCKDKEHLHKRERFYIESLKAELNKIIPTRSNKEWYKDNKEHLKEQSKEYRKDNKHKIAVKNKEYRGNNKEKIANQDKEYRENNKEKITNREKKYRGDNREKITNREKKYRGDNREKIAVKKKEWRGDNKEKIAVKNKEYRENNKEKIAVKKKEYYEKNKLKPV